MKKISNYANIGCVLLFPEVGFTEPAEKPSC